MCVEWFQYISSWGRANNRFLSGANHCRGVFLRRGDASIIEGQENSFPQPIVHRDSPHRRRVRSSGIDLFQIEIRLIRIRRLQ